MNFQRLLVQLIYSSVFLSLFCLIWLHDLIPQSQPFIIYAIKSLGFYYMCQDNVSLWGEVRELLRYVLKSNTFSNKVCELLACSLERMYLYVAREMRKDSLLQWHWYWLHSEQSRGKLHIHDQNEVPSLLNNVIAFVLDYCNILIHFGYWWNLRETWCHTHSHSPQLIQYVNTIQIFYYLYHLKDS